MSELELFKKVIDYNPYNWDVFFCYENYVDGKRTFEVEEIIGLIDVTIDDEEGLYGVAFLEKLPEDYLDNFDVYGKFHRINRLYFSECVIDPFKMRLFFVE